MSNTTESIRGVPNPEINQDSSFFPVALITGGAKGIGRETAKLFFSQGYRVAVCGRDQEALDRFVEHHNLDTERTQGTSNTNEAQVASMSKATQGNSATNAASVTNHSQQVLALQADITKVTDCQRVVGQVVAHFGRLDVLVNNAGMAMRGSFKDTDLQVYQTLLNINFLGALTMTQVALPFLESTKGSVVFVSTLAGLFGLPGVGAYSASKMPLTALAQTMQIEFGTTIHTGILYVSFTENDPGKKVYQADGSLAELHRSKNSSTQKDVAQAIFTMVRSRKKRKIMTFLGSGADWFFRWFPNLAVFFISWFGKSSSMGGITGKK
jgi:dehydrogenase/reductase SDR family protein 7B